MKNVCCICSLKSMYRYTFKCNVMLNQVVDICNFGRKYMNIRESYFHLRKSDKLSHIN